MVVFVADEDALACTPHAVLDIMLLEALEARENRGILLGLGFFGAEGVVGERVETDCLRLVAIEIFGEDRRVRGLEGSGRNGRHLGLLAGVCLGGLCLSLSLLLVRLESVVVRYLCESGRINRHSRNGTGGEGWTYTLYVEGLWNSMTLSFSPHNANTVL